MSPLLFLVALSGAAEARALSLEEALRITQDASESIDIAEAGVEGAIGDTWTARSSYLPTVSARGQYTRTFATEYSRLFGDTGGGLGSSLPFGQENTYRFDFTASQTLYGGGRQWAQTRMVAASRSSADLALEAERASAALTTAQAYYDAALADRVLAIREAALAQAEVTFGHVQLAFEEGHQAEFDVLRAQVDVENQRVAVIRQRRLHDTAQVRLAQQLDLPKDVPLELTTPLEPSDAVVSAAVSTSGVAAGAEDRSAVQQVANLETISRSGIAIARSQALPSLVLSGSLGWTHYPDSALPKTDLDLYYKNASAGLTLSIPLFSGGRVYGGLLSAQADLATAQAQLARTEELADLDTRDAALALQSAEAQWAATAGTSKQAERAYAIAEVRFQEGLSTQTELADARLLLQQAQANRAQAARDLQVARIRTALLPALPIGAGASY